MVTSLEMNRPQLLAIWRRRRLPMLIALVLVLVGTFVAALTWPPTYVSTGTILIEQQEVPLDLVRSTISSFADQRIQMINQRVMTSDNLLGIVQKYDLYSRERKRRGPREDSGPHAQRRAFRLHQGQRHRSTARPTSGSDDRFLAELPEPLA